MTSHNNHKTKVIFGPFGKHYAKEICITCNAAFVSWRSESHLVQLLYKELDSLNRRGNTIDLKVPYKDKDAVKALGAKWDSHKKVWYISADDITVIKKLSGYITHDAIDFYEQHQNIELLSTTPELTKYHDYKKTQYESNEFLEQCLQYNIKESNDFYDN